MRHEAHGWCEGIQIDDRGTVTYYVPEDTSYDPGRAGGYETDVFDDEDVEVLLEDATGRAHAAWWCLENVVGHRDYLEPRAALLNRCANAPLSRPGDAEALRLVCLHVAGMGVES